MLRAPPPWGDAFDGEAPPPPGPDDDAAPVEGADPVGGSILLSSRVQIGPHSAVTGWPKRVPFRDALLARDGPLPLLTRPATSTRPRAPADPRYPSRPALIRSESPS